MPGRLPLSILIGLAACTWALVLFILGSDVDATFFKPFSVVIGVIAGALAAFDRWVWSWPLVRSVHGRPHLGGTYVGEIRSDWTNPETGEQPPPIPAAIVIAQTFTGLSVALCTAESASTTVAAALVGTSDDRQLVAGIYRNEPRLSIQARSRVHYGGLKLNVGGQSGERLHGSYWTDRGTSGELDFTFLARVRAKDFESASALQGTESADQNTDRPSDER